MTRSSRLLVLGVAVIVVSVIVAVIAVLGRDAPITVTAPEGVDVAGTTSTGDADDAAGDDTGDDTDGRLVGSAYGEEDAPRLTLPLEVPTGHEVIAVTGSYEATVASVPAPGDTVNVYGVFSNGVPTEYLDEETLVAYEEDPELHPLPTTAVVRMFPGVEVLGIQGAATEAAAGQVTLLLAFEPDAAERMVYMTALEELFFTLTGDDEPATDGLLRTRPTVLDGLAVQGLG